MNSKQKGARGEREFAAVCREHGYEARRGQQYNGIEGEDVIGLPGIHIEVKRYKAITHSIILEALAQSLRDCKRCDRAIVAYKEDYGKWYIVMDVTDFTEMFVGEEVSHEGAELVPMIMLADDWFRIYRDWEVTK